MHERRQGLLRDDSGVLRLLREHDEGRLQLLHDDERHARLLLLIKAIGLIDEWSDPEEPPRLFWVFFLRNLVSFVMNLINSIEFIKYRT